MREIRVEGNRDGIKKEVGTGKDMRARGINENAVRNTGIEEESVRTVDPTCVRW